MATTSATGNQGSTGDQDPEPQQEILATGAGIRPPATARAGDAGRRLVQEDMAHDQAGQGRAPVPWTGTGAGPTAAAVQLDAVGGNPARPTRTQRPTKAATRAENTGVTRTTRPRTPPTMPGSTKPRSAGSRPSKRTWQDCLISNRTTPRTLTRCLPKNRALASITPSRRRWLSWLSPRLPTAPAMKAGNAKTTRMKRRSGGCTGQGQFIQRPEPARRWTEARRLGQRSGEVRRQRRRLSPSIKRPELRRCESARKDPSRRRCGPRQPRLPGTRGPRRGQA